MDYGGLLELIKKRRSIHKFKPDPIPDEYVDKIIEAARWERGDEIFASGLASAFLL